jgi:hypothetical protein
VLAYDGKEPEIDPKTGTVRTRWGGRMMKHPVTGWNIPDPSDQIPIYRYINPRSAEWQEADYIISNPPFIGTKRMKAMLGEGYVDALRTTIRAVPESSDFVMYWWHKAANLVSQNRIKRFGFITTNSLPQIFNRRILEVALNDKNPLSIIYAIPDHPWIDSFDGAAVRIAMTAAELGSHKGRLLTLVKEQETSDGIADIIFLERTGYITSKLSTGGNITLSKGLISNSGVSGMGAALHGAGFILSPEQASEYKRYGDKVIRSYMGGKDLLQSPRERYVIDFSGLSESEASFINPIAFQHVINYVRPEREQNRRESIKRLWWRFGWERPLLRKALTGIHRFIATTETAKHRIFQFVDTKYIPDHMVVTIAIDDGFVLAVLSSKIHVLWSLSTGGTLEERPRYNKNVCFDPFPFPDPTPEQKQKIRELGERLDAHRKRVQAQQPEVTITGNV